MKPAETELNPPGIFVLRGGSPTDAAHQVIEAFPGAARLRELASVVGTSTDRAIREVGFDVMPDPTRRFPNHHRLIHPGGPEKFHDLDALARLSEAFTDSVPGGHP